MRSSKRRRGKSNEQKAMEMLAQMASKQGTSIDIEKISRSVQEHPDSAMLEREGILSSLHYRHKIMLKKCRRCQEPFGTNYCGVGYCSNACRSLDLRDLFGEEWHPKKDTWGPFEPPVTISPAALLSLEAWARNFLQDIDRVRQTVQDRHQAEIERNLPSLPGSSDSSAPAELVSDTEKTPEEPLRTDPLLEDDALRAIFG